MKENFLCFIYRFCESGSAKFLGVQLHVGIECRELSVFRKSNIFDLLWLEGNLVFLQGIVQMVMILTCNWHSWLHDLNFRLSFKGIDLFLKLYCLHFIECLSRWLLVLFFEDVFTFPQQKNIPFMIKYFFYCLP